MSVDRAAWVSLIHDVKHRFRKCKARHPGMGTLYEHRIAEVNTTVITMRPERRWFTVTATVSVRLLWMPLHHANRGSIGAHSDSSVSHVPDVPQPDLKLTAAPGRPCNLLTGPHFWS